MSENISVSVSRDHDTGDVVVQFGELVKVLNLPPDQARRLAQMLLLAAQAESVPSTS